MISLYLNVQPDQHGQDHYAAFVRKELHARARTYPPRSDARESFDRDVERIDQYLATELSPSANGVASFACSGRDGFFEALSLDVPILRHRLSVSHEPHLYPLELLLGQAKRQDGLPTGKKIQQIPAEPKSASKPSRHPTVSHAKSKTARSKTPKASSPSPASRASNMRRTPGRTS